MSALHLDRLPEKACGLKLHKIVGERLIACETVIFKEGRSAVNTTLRRAALSGRVEVEPDGPLPDFYADVLIDADGTWDATVALDANSYRSLKERWMRCNLEPAHD